MLNPGDRFGDYTVVKLLGRGGMGAVYLLENANGVQVAAKILDPESAGDHESRKRFVREAELALGVKHPNLVETYDVGEDPDTGLCYILMEYVPGGSLADYLKENGALPIEDAVAVVEAMAQVLELARQKGIVHRDIKPANIMFDAEGTPKLADLGIARGGSLGTDTTTVTQTGMMIGTPAYMAPEQMLDAHNVDTRADIYSLGVVFYEMLTGERPNKDDTVVQLMAKAVKGEPLPDVRTLRPEVSASLAQLLAMMVVPDKDGRIATPGQITNALDIIERGGTFEADETKAQRREELRALRRRRKRRRHLVLVSAAIFVMLVALAGIGLGVAWLMRGEEAEVRVEAEVPRPVRETVVVTNTVEKNVVQIRTVTNVTERIVRVEKAAEPQTKESRERPSRDASERRVGHVLLLADRGVRRDLVGRIAAWVEKMLPQYVELYGDPYAEGLKDPPFIVRLNYQEGKSRGGSYRPGWEKWEITIGNDGDWDLSESTLSYMLAASLVFAPEQNWASLVFYANHLQSDSDAGTVARVVAQGRAVDPKMSDYDWRGNPRRKGVPRVNGGKDYYALHQWRSFGPLDELRKERPALMKDYFARKIERAKAGGSASGLSVEDEVALFSAVLGKDVQPVFRKYGWPLGRSNASTGDKPNRKIMNVTPRKRRLDDLPESLRQDLQKQVERSASRWRGGKGCLVTGRLVVKGEDRPTDVASWAWLNGDGTFTAAVYRGRGVVFAKHGYEVVELRVPQANEDLDRAVVYDFGTVTMERLQEDKARKLDFGLSLPPGVETAEVSLSLYNNEPVGNDWGTIGREKTSVLAERRTCAPGEKIVFKGYSFFQYRLKVTAAGCPTYEATLSDDADSIAPVKMLLAKRAVFSLRSKDGGAWTRKSVLVDAEDVLMLKEETDEWGNRGARMYLDPYKSERGVGFHFGFGPDYYDDLGELSPDVYDAQEKSGTLPIPRRLDYQDREFLPGHIYRMQEKHWKIDMLISFDFYGSPEAYESYVEKNGLSGEIAKSDMSVSSFDYEARFPAKVPMGVELKRAGDAAQAAIARKERQLEEVRQYFDGQPHELSSAKTESEAKRALSNLEKLVRRYQSIRLSPTGKWALKRNEAKAETDKIQQDLLLFLKYILSTRCPSGPATPVLKKRISQLQKGKIR